MCTVGRVARPLPSDEFRPIIRPTNTDQKFRPSQQAQSVGLYRPITQAVGSTRNFNLLNKAGSAGKLCPLIVLASSLFSIIKLYGAENMLHHEHCYSFALQKHYYFSYLKPCKKKHMCCFGRNKHMMKIFTNSALKYNKKMYMNWRC
jgi:hypothetical protein